jgi:hypothetical protein
MMTALFLPSADLMKPRLLLLCLITLLSATAPVQARTYLVEVVIFARSAGMGAEHWRANPAYPATGNAIELGPVGNGRFNRLPGSRMELNHIAATLERRGGYRVLEHVGWVQPGLSANQAIKVNVGNGAGLNGTIKVSLAHYLHLTADLAYTASVDGPTVTMKQSRRMRSNEIHYLDGPVLGIIVLMTPAG